MKHFQFPLYFAPIVFGLFVFNFSAQAATNIFEFSAGNLDATIRGRSGFTSSAITQQYASSVTYNQNGQTNGNFDVASVTPASGSSAEARDAVGWLLALPLLQTLGIPWTLPAPNS